MADPSRSQKPRKEVRVGVGGLGAAEAVKGGAAVEAVKGGAAVEAVKGGAAVEQVAIAVKRSSERLVEATEDDSEPAGVGRPAARTHLRRTDPSLRRLESGKDRPGPANSVSRCQLFRGAGRRAWRGLRPTAFGQLSGERFQGGA